MQNARLISKYAARTDGNNMHISNEMIVRFWINVCVVGRTELWEFK